MSSERSVPKSRYTSRKISRRTRSDRRDSNSARSDRRDFYPIEPSSNSAFSSHNTYAAPKPLRVKATTPRRAPKESGMPEDGGGSARRRRKVPSESDDIQRADMRENDVAFSSLAQDILLRIDNDGELDSIPFLLRQKFVEATEYRMSLIPIFPERNERALIGLTRRVSEAIKLRVPYIISLKDGNDLISQCTTFSPKGRPNYEPDHNSATIDEQSYQSGKSHRDRSTGTGSKSTGRDHNNGFGARRDDAASNSSTELLDAAREMRRMPEYEKSEVQSMVGGSDPFPFDITEVIRQQSEARQQLICEIRKATDAMSNANKPDMKHIWELHLERLRGELEELSKKRPSEINAQLGMTDDDYDGNEPYAPSEASFVFRDHPKEERKNRAFDISDIVYKQSKTRQQLMDEIESANNTLGTATAPETKRVCDIHLTKLHTELERLNNSNVVLDDTVCPPPKDPSNSDAATARQDLETFVSQRNHLLSEIQMATRALMVATKQEVKKMCIQHVRRLQSELQEVNHFIDQETAPAPLPSSEENTALPSHRHLILNRLVGDDESGTTPDRITNPSHSTRFPDHLSNNTSQDSFGRGSASPQFNKMGLKSSGLRMETEVGKDRGHVKVRAPATLPEGYTFEGKMGDRLFTAVVPSGGVKKGQIFYCDPITGLASKATPAQLQTMRVRAPATLPEGYCFEVRTGDTSFQATVPKGGVKKDQLFDSIVPENTNLPPRNKNNNDIPRTSKVIGQWRDGLFNCLVDGVDHPMCLNGCFFPQIALAQVMARMKLTWCGQTGTPNETRNTFRIMLHLTLALILLNATLLATPLYFWQFKYYFLGIFLVQNAVSVIFLAVLVYRTRTHIRSRYFIPGDKFFGWGDALASVMCTCCAITQMGRHTAEYETYRALCCAETGLPGHVKIPAHPSFPSKTDSLKDPLNDLTHF